MIKKMKNKQPKSKIQAILQERKMKIIDLFNKIKEENDKPVAKYMISQIVNGKRTNYEIITLNKICRALGVSPNQIIEENPTRFSNTKSIKSNTTKPRSGRVSPKPKIVDVDINIHSGNGYIDEIVDPNSLEDIKRSLNMEEAKDEGASLEEQSERTDWQEEIINDKDNKWGNGSIKEDEEPIVEHDGMRYNPETLETPEQDEEEDEEEDDDFGF